MRLKGKAAIVTGGASGFGAGIAGKFLAEGARVMIADVNGNAADAKARELGCEAIETDVSSDSDVAAMVASARSAFGKIDILVNNAGVTHLPAPLDEVSEADFDRVFAVNCKSVYLTARHVVPAFKEAGFRRNPQRGVDGRRKPEASAQLVQCVQGLDEHGNQDNGGRTGSRRHPRERAESRGGRNAAPEELSRRGHAGNAGQIPHDDTLGQVLDA